MFHPKLFTKIHQADKRSDLENESMKKGILAVIIALGVMVALTFTASAAPGGATIGKQDRFDGKFQGLVYGDKGSKAPVTLNLNQDGTIVEGTVFIGNGLFVDGGFCGSGYIPSGSQVATGQISKSDASVLAATSNFKVSGMGIKINLNGTLSPDGDELKTQAKINLPWLCGRSPVISGVLEKV